MGNDVVLSICCLTYNHEPYIKQCLDGFLKQKTNFKFEVLIHDDASTDKTVDVIRDYERVYPNIIKPIYQSENQYSKGVKPTFEFNFPRAKGKYIALCEGDDYWTDPLKLQKQVDVLEENEDCVACHHWHEYLFDRENEEAFLQPAPTVGEGYLPQKTASVREIFDNRLRVKTRTVLYRNIINKDFLPAWYNSVAFGDVPLSMLMGRFGKFYFIDEVMAVYRITDKGISTMGKNTMSNANFQIDHLQKWVSIWDNGNREFDYKYNREASKTIRQFNTSALKLLNYKDVRQIKLIWFNLFKRNAPIGSRLNSVFFILKISLRKVRVAVINKIK
jgi:glycosyltransferase involved in cell wall biosynthesis